tara:strand:+ start:647 stop:1972 length:1326 start_codon:yes stop_codon:yes gene_type:complete
MSTGYVGKKRTPELAFWEFSRSQDGSELALNNKTRKETIKMNDDKNMMKQELTQCDECCSKDLKCVPEKGETWCLECGLVHKDQLIEANDNGAALFGEGAHYQAVRNDKDINRRLGGTGPKMRYDSRSVKDKKKYYFLEKIDRSTVRNPHPFAQRVKNNIESLYGRHALHILDFLVEMSCRPLTGEQEVIRQKQGKAMSKSLGMPKQSICRKKKGIKGSSDEQNAVIIAAAIVELAGDLGIMPKFDRRATMEQAGIVPKQIMSARISILRHWKARVTMGWAAMPPRKNANDKREDAIVQALEHTFEMLGDHHNQEDYERVLYETEARIALLKEGTGEALTINIEERMLVSVCAYASLTTFGLQSGAADLIADVFGLTSSGIRSRYEALVANSASGDFQDNGAFDMSQTCQELLNESHKQNALIAKFRLGRLCGKRSFLSES